MVYPPLLDAIRPLSSDAYKRQYVEVLDSPRRMVLRVAPRERSGFDGSKMHRATIESFERARRLLTSPD